MLELTLQEPAEDHIEAATVWINAAAIAAIAGLRNGGSEIYLIGGTVLEVSEPPERLRDLLGARLG